MSQLNERGANSERNSALWGTGGRGGDRSSGLWGKGGRGWVVATLVVALAAVSVPELLLKTTGCDARLTLPASFTFAVIVTTSPPLPN